MKKNSSSNLPLTKSLHSFRWYRPSAPRKHHLQVFGPQLRDQNSWLQRQKLDLRSPQNPMQHAGQDLKGDPERQQADRESGKDSRVRQLVQPAQGQMHRGERHWLIYKNYSAYNMISYHLPAQDTRISDTISPYSASAYPKIRIRIRPTKMRSCWALARMPASPTIPIE